MALRPNIQIKVGTYTGDGLDDRNITGIGFRPDLVIVKGGANVACIRTRQMRGDMSIVMSGYVATGTNLIQELLNDGFQVGTNAAVNTNAVVYYYIAIRGTAGQSHFRTGNYRGTGGDGRNFTVGGLNFTPDLVGIFGDDGVEKVWRSSAMSGDLTTFFSGIASDADYIQNLQSNGFQLGSKWEVNKSTTEFFFFAMKALAEAVAVGSYTGDGVDNREITGIGFRPDLVIVKSRSTGIARIRTSDMTTDAQGGYLSATAAAADGIQSLSADGFQIGTVGSVNTNAQVYDWFAFKSGDFNAPVARTAA